MARFTKAGSRALLAVLYVLASIGLAPVAQGAVVQVEEPAPYLIPCCIDGSAPMTVAIPHGTRVARFDLYFTNYEDAFVTVVQAPTNTGALILGHQCGYYCTQHWEVPIDPTGPQFLTFTFYYQYGDKLGFWVGQITWLGPWNDATPTPSPTATPSPTNTPPPTPTATATMPPVTQAWSTSTTLTLDTVAGSPDICGTRSTPTPGVDLTPQPSTRVQAPALRADLGRVPPVSKCGLSFQAPFTCKIFFSARVEDTYARPIHIWLGSDLTILANSACPQWMMGSQQSMMIHLYYPPGYGDTQSPPEVCPLAVCSQQLLSRSDVRGIHNAVLTAIYTPPPGMVFLVPKLIDACEGDGHAIQCLLMLPFEVPATT